MSEKRTMPAYIRGLEDDVKRLEEKRILTEDLLLGALLMLHEAGLKPTTSQLLERARIGRKKP